MKTGALITASVVLGALSSNLAQPERLARLRDFARLTGLAFQIRDDILDVEGDAAVIGKTAGKDAANAKPTYPAILGMDASRTLLRDLARRMRDALSRIALANDDLPRLAAFAVERTS